MDSLLLDSECKKNHGRLAHFHDAACPHNTSLDTIVISKLGPMTSRNAFAVQCNL